ncbi:hypothetical protein [Maribacter sp. 2308TA10-17]|uniref:hypothetical protein n=1 Tax=Maribacter sp. 2308TA10-17 TaxID=3386276 RepID=UPI0039BD2C12
MANSPKEIFRVLGADFHQKPVYYYFWGGILLYMLGFALSTLPNPIYIICDVLRLVGILIFATSGYQMISYSFQDKYLKIIFTLYIFWMGVTVFRGLKLEYEFTKDLLFNPFGGLFLYFTPLFLLFPKTHLFYKATFKALIFAALLFGIFMLYSSIDLLDLKYELGRDRLEYYVKLLGLPVGFLVLTYPYHNKQRRFIAFFVILLVVLSATYRARRGLMFMSGTVFIFTSFIYILKNKKQFLTIFFGALLTVLFSGYAYSLFGAGDSVIVNKVTERLDEDTRTGVEEYYYADMQVRDWIIGRGMSGLVAAPIDVDPSEEHPGYRDGVETDYLTIILKGGLISLGLLLLIAIPAMIKGLFFSKNLLSKAAGFWILLWLVSLYPSTVTSFTLNYMLVWISIGICFSDTIRLSSENTIIKYLSGTKQNAEVKKKYS